MAQTTNFDLNFPTPLNAKLDALDQWAAEHKLSPSMSAKKAHMLLKALTHYRYGLRIQDSPKQWHGLANRADFVQTPTAPPPYFARAFNIRQITLESNPDYYDYRADPNSIWVDFANVKLGGGVFGTGFVQEEVMCCETPDLANAAACGIETRTGADGASAGSPEPVVILGVNHVMKIEKDLKLDPLGFSALDSKCTMLDKPQTFHVLAVAAPRLPDDHIPTQIHPTVINDVFNSCCAAFSLARAFVNPMTINTGRFGAGVFYNNPYVVHVLQCFAAEHVSATYNIPTTIRFWGYTAAQHDRAVQDFKAIHKAFGAGTIAQLLAAAHDYWTQNPPPQH